MTRSDISPDIKLADRDNKESLFILERYHNLVKWHSHDIPALEILARRVIESLLFLVSESVLSALKHLEAGSIEW